MTEYQTPYVRITVYNGGDRIFQDEGRYEVDYNSSGNILYYTDNNGKLHKWYNACVCVETVEEPK